MYTAEDFKNDLIVNLKADNTFDNRFVQAIEDSIFEFQDSSSFTRVQWNTYIRVLKIYSRVEDKKVIDTLKDELYRVSHGVHGVKDDFMLMELQTYASAAMEKSAVLTNEIVIMRKVVIDKSKDYQGAGGFATIYRKYDEHTQTTYAYKIFDPHPFQTSEPEIMKKRFIREAKKLMSYDHPNIVRAYDFGFLGDESAYIKMEYIEGKRIYDYIQDKNLSDEDKTELAMQYISAMSYIHNKSDIHRDISYSNVMVSNNGLVKVLDFGFTKGDSDTSYDTKYADILHKFSPPDEKYDLRTEVYCIGAVLFSIYTGTEFHFGRISDLIGKCDECFFKAINKCIDISPDKRFQSAIELEKYVLSYQHGVNDEEANNFSLDEFRSSIDTIMEIVIKNGSSISLTSMKNWVEISIPDYILGHKFLSNIQLDQLLIEIDNVMSVELYRNVNCAINKNIIVDIYNAYKSFDDTSKTAILKGLRTIISTKSREVEDLPF